jgi:hypothetical protein
MDDREQTIHGRITREIEERVRELLRKLKEAEEKGDKEEADRVVDELVQLAETYWPWMIGKGKINPVQEAIWAVRLAKSPGILERIKRILAGPQPPSRKDVEEAMESLKWFREELRRRLGIPESEEKEESVEEEKKATEEPRR